MNNMCAICLSLVFGHAAYADQYSIQGIPSFNFEQVPEFDQVEIKQNPLNCEAVVNVDSYDDFLTVASKEPICAKNNIVIDSTDIPFPMSAVGELRQGRIMDFPYCGAVQISDEFILSAAHCVVDTNHLTYRAEGQDNSIPVDTEIVHPEFSAVWKAIKQARENNDEIRHIALDRLIGATHDLAILRLREKLPMNFEWTITEPNNDFNIYRSGSNLESFSHNPYCDYDHQEIISNFGHFIKEREMVSFARCSGGPGDSGGPFWAEKDGVAYLFSIVSTGEGEGQEIFPGVYDQTHETYDQIWGPHPDTIREFIAPYLNHN